MKWLDKVLYFASGVSFFTALLALNIPEPIDALISGALSVGCWMMANWQPKGWNHNKRASGDKS